MGGRKPKWKKKLEKQQAELGEDAVLEEDGRLPGDHQLECSPPDPPIALLALNPAGTAVALAVGPHLRVFDKR